MRTQIPRASRRSLLGLRAQDESEPAVLTVTTDDLEAPPEQPVADDDDLEPDEAEAVARSATTDLTVPAQSSRDELAESDTDDEAFQARSFEDPTRFLASKLTFGLTRKLRGDLESMTYREFLEAQLALDKPDPRVEEQVKQNTLLYTSTEQIGDQNDNTTVLRQTKSVCVYRARYSDHQLYEMMCHVWMDHFNVYTSGVGKSALMLYQEQTIRPHAMGRFVDLLVATAKAPAMLEYLNNQDSNANAPGGLNENYGRELLELHTVGVGNHSEDDVVAAARLMSGWRYTRKNNVFNFQFQPSWHYNGPVTLLGRRFENPGEQRGINFLKFLARRPDTAELVAYKICRRFISDNPPRSIVASAAEVYLKNDTELKPVLRHIFRSDEFKNSERRKVRRPFEFLVAAMRVTNADVTFDNLNGARRWLSDVGNEPYDWAPPDGYPDDNEHWVDTAGFTARWILAARLTNGKGPFSFDADNLRYGPNRSLYDVVQALTTRFGYGPIGERGAKRLLGRLGHDPADTMASLSEEQYADLMAVLLCHPAFQQR